jgi:hypothetical protein
MHSMRRISEPDAILKGHLPLDPTIAWILNVLQKPMHSRFFSQDGTIREVAQPLSGIVQQEIFS